MGVTPNQTVNDGVAHSKNPRKCTYHMTFDLDLNLEHTLDAGLPGDHRVQVWSRSSHLPGRRSDFRASTKVPVSHGLWSWPWPWAHPGCTLTWSPSCESLVAIRPFVCEKKQFAQKFTDRQTDRRRTPRHCISSFLEWAKNYPVKQKLKVIPLADFINWELTSIMLTRNSRTCLS